MGMSEIDTVKKIVIEKISDHEFAELTKAHSNFLSAVNNVILYIRVRRLADNEFIVQLHNAKNEAWNLWCFANRVEA